MKKILPILALGLALGAFFFLRGNGFTTFWKQALVISVPMARADALIVLGGEPLARPQEAARLYREGVAPKVFVTGVGDSAKNRRILTAEGVPASAIITETNATSTLTNARLLKPILEESGVRSALLVTSPFHTRRALATFRKLIPDVRFGVVDASIGWWSTQRGRTDLNRFVLIEFLKTAGYWLFYGVSPFTKTDPAETAQAG